MHYVCDEQAGWPPDLDDIGSKVSDRTRAIVVINPNNPTGAVYSREVLEAIVEVARQHELLILSDEIYDKILYDGVEHTPIAALAPDLLCLTFNGLSKAYRVAGFRTGLARDLRAEGARAQLHRGPRHPRQHAAVRQRADAARDPDRARRLPDHQRADPARRPARSSSATGAWEMLNEIPGVSCVKPSGALYLFPRLDPARSTPISDDEQFALDLLREEKMLVVQGTGFNWPNPDHFRIVFLPRVEDLEDAIGRIGRFLRTYKP